MGFFLLGCAGDAAVHTDLRDPEQLADETAQAGADDANLAPVLACRAITTQALKIPRLKISSARAVAASQDGGVASEPAHCQLTGTLDERTGRDNQRYAIGFELRLPMRWNGRFFFQGGGGTDGMILPAYGTLQDGRRALDLGYAVASTDAGHQMKLFPPIVGGSLFGLDPQARLDYGYNAIGRLTPIAKRIVATFYGREARRSYFVGCSNGGRQAMVAAARFADQYDGFLAGDPGFNLPKAAIQHAWDVQQLSSISPAKLAGAFTVDELSHVGRKILDVCDGLDGAADGMVYDFAACQVAFDLARDVVTCTGERTGTCLTAAQKKVLSNIMAGPTNSQGEALYSGWLWDPGIAASAPNFGSFRSWKLENAALGGLSLVASLAGSSLPYIFVTPPVDVARGAGFFDTPVMKYLLKFDFDVDAPKIGQIAGPFTESALSFMTPPNPTRLETLRSRGKLIVYHGAADPVFSAADTVHWYDALRRDTPDAETFARLFVVPGMGHCGSGVGLDSFDLLTPLVDWVERGVAPERVIARRAAGDNPDLPKDWSPARTRPLCAYPEHAVLRAGASDLELESSFACAQPGEPGSGGDGGVPGDAGPSAEKEATIVPDESWTCGLAAGIPSPEGGEVVLEATLETGAALDVGETQFGQRTVRAVHAGSFRGPRIAGTIEAGGIDHQLGLPSGAVEHESRTVLRTDDGAVIYVRSCGVADGAAVRIVPVFEAPASGPYAWLNGASFVGTRSVEGDTVKLRIVQPKARPSAQTVHVPADDARPQQPWTCPGPVGTRGTTVALQANVTLGAYLSVGASSAGTRNIVVINGGTFEGPRLRGQVVPGGADYQLRLPTSTTPADIQIEARYVLRTDDGALITVRNCGTGLGTALLFETRKDGPYAFLNDAAYQGTIGVGAGSSVNITAYQTP